MKVEIKRLEPDSWKEYRQLRLEALLAEPQAYLDTYEGTLKKPDTFWIDRLQQVKDGLSWLLFASFDGKLVGMIGAYIEEKKSKPTIVSFFVSESKRGLGIGKLLLESLILELSKINGITDIKLAVNNKQESALHLYKSLGFKIIKKEKRKYANGIDISYIMERPLQSTK